MNKKRRMRKTDVELLASLKNQIGNARGGFNSTTNSDRATALDYYMADESLISAEDGESKVQTREVLESVERELGRQLKVFCGGTKAVTFDPTGSEDEEQAAQETDYVNHVFHKENNGFKVMHDWLKSTLLESVAYAKVWAEKSDEYEVQTYTGLSDMGLMQVLEQDGYDEVEPLEHDERVEYLTETDEMGNPVEVPVMVHDIKVRVKTSRMKIVVKATPNEEIGVYKNHNELSLENCPFVYHKPQGITASDLIAAGYSRKLVKTLPSYTDSENELESARDDAADDDSTGSELDIDDSTREIEVYECYVRYDYDDDGIAELRKVTISGDQILDNEECDFIPFAALSPLPMPHKHDGLSYADLVMDLQDINTVLMQQMLTNLYRTNMPEREIVDEKVNIDDLMISKSGSYKRVKEPGMIRDLTVPFTAGASLPIVQLLREIKDNRVGRSGNTDPNILRDTTEGAFQLNTELENELSEKLSRIFAETGVKELFRMIHELAIKHVDKPMVMKMRNKYVEVNPTEWKRRANMTVVVGLGTGNKDKEIGQLMTIAQKQEEHLLQGSPLVDLKRLHNTYSRIIESAGLKDPDLYFLDPASDEAKQKMAEQQSQPPEPDIQVMMLQMQKQIEDQKTQLKAQDQQIDAMFKAHQAELDRKKLELQEKQLEQDALKHAADIEQKRYDSDMRQETTVAIESMKAGVPIAEALREVLSEEKMRNDEMLTDAINGVLDHIAQMSQEQAMALAGVTDGFNQQIQTLAGQMNRPKQVIYDDEGMPIRVESVIE